MTSNGNDDSGSLVGQLVKVLRWDSESQVAHVRFPNGNSGRLTGLGGDVPSGGAVILIGSDRWERYPDDLWPETNSIGVVRRLLDNGSLLVEGNLGLKVVANECQIAIQLNNTIEYSEVDGVIGVISESPIRHRDFGSDNENIGGEYLVATTEGALSFSDFGGYPIVIARARELIETQFNRRELLDKIGARPVKGILFTGPPGTGKTHLARIIAHESKADFYLVSGPSIISKWVGDTEDTLRKIFEAATGSMSGRAIIFFDEIDSIAERRTGDSHEASKRLVAQLLTLMDGFDDKGKSVVVIAATNRVEALDPALTRPGRFDWDIQFGSPTLIDRLEILRVGAKRLRTSNELPFEDIALLTAGWSAADLSAIWVEAALLAAGDQRDSISSEDMVLAFERVVVRPRQKMGEEAGA